MEVLTYFAVSCSVLRQAIGDRRQATGDKGPRDSECVPQRRCNGLRRRLQVQQRRWLDVC